MTYVVLAEGVPGVKSKWNSAKNFKFLPLTRFGWKRAEIGPY